MFLIMLRNISWFMVSGNLTMSRYISMQSLSLANFSFRDFSAVIVEVKSAPEELGLARCVLS